MSEESNQRAIVNVGANGALTPTSFEGLYRLATIMASSGFMPKSMDKVETVFVAIQYGLEVGLSPMQAVQSLAVINGRPTLWGDALLGLVRGSGLLESFSETMTGEGDATTAFCTLKRRGDPMEIIGQFSVSDAKRAGLWGKTGPWTTHPRRMLKMRARSFALRDGFPDVLKGLYAREELHGEIDMGPAEVVTSKAALAALKPAKAAPEAPTLDLTPSVPVFQDAMEWIASAQTREELDLALDAARDIEIDPEAIRELEAAAVAQATLIEGMNQ